MRWTSSKHFMEEHHFKRDQKKNRNGFTKPSGLKGSEAPSGGTKSFRFSTADVPWIPHAFNMFDMYVAFNAAKAQGVNSSGILAPAQFGYLYYEPLKITLDGAVKATLVNAPLIVATEETTWFVLRLEFTEDQMVDYLMAGKLFALGPSRLTWPIRVAVERSAMIIAPLGEETWADARLSRER